MNFETKKIIIHYVGSWNALSLKEHPTLPDSYTYREFYEAKKFS